MGKRLTNGWRLCLAGGGVVVGGFLFIIGNKVMSNRVQTQSPAAASERMKGECGSFGVR